MIVLLAELAWGDGELLEAATPDGLSWPLLTGAVLFADELERDLEICNAGLDAARERDSPAGYAAASYCRAWALYEQGAVRAALADAKAALDAAPDARRTHVRTAYGAIACCQIQHGELEPAEAELHDASPGAIRGARPRLWLTSRWESEPRRAGSPGPSSSWRGGSRPPAW